MKLDFASLAPLVINRALRTLRLKKDLTAKYAKNLKLLEIP